MTSEYTKQAEEFLAANSITFSAVLIGSDCPQFCEDARKRIDMDKVDVFPRKTHIHGKHYRCTFTRATGPVVVAGRTAPQMLAIDFWNSYADAEFNALGNRAHRDGETLLMYGREGKRKISAYDVLSTIQKSDAGTFEDFCSDFGYDSDSRQAEKIYHAVAAEWKRVKAFFTEAEIEAMREIN